MEIDNAESTAVAVEALAVSPPANGKRSTKRKPGSLVIRPTRNDAERSNADFAELIYRVRPKIGLQNEKLPI